MTLYHISERPLEAAKFYICYFFFNRNSLVSFDFRSCGFKLIKSRFHYSNFLETNSRGLEEVVNLSESKFRYSNFLESNSRQTRDVSSLSETSSRHQELVANCRRLVGDKFVATLGGSRSCDM
jgi:hypothetical protein